MTHIDARLHLRTVLALWTVVLISGCSTGSRDIRWELKEPAEVMITDDDTPDFIGVCSELEAPHRRRFCAFDGASFKLLWQSKRLEGNAPERGMTIAAAGDKMVYVDETAHFHVYDARDGKELPPFHRFGDRAKQLCAPTEHRGKLWIQTADGSGLLFDPATVKLSPGTWPPSCISQMCMTDIGMNTDRLCREERPKVPGFASHWVWTDGKNGLARGGKYPGSGAPLIVGFSPGAKAESVRWMRGLAGDDPLSAHDPMDPIGFLVVGGRAVYTYDDLAGHRHIVAIDPATGKTLWDVPSPKGHISATASRVYLHDGGQLFVHDAVSGKLLGSVGRVR